jgi:hypothetical protein
VRADSPSAATAAIAQRELENRMASTSRVAGFVGLTSRLDRKEGKLNRQ